MGATKLNFGVKEWLGNNPNPTKGEFVDALQSGQFGGATTGAFGKNIDNLLGGVNLDAKTFSTEFGDVDPQFMSPEGSFGGYIDVNKSQLSQEAIDALPAGFFKAKGGRIGLYQGGGEFEAPDFMNMSEVVENVNGDIVEEENITEANASNRIKQLYEQIEAGVNVNESKTELFQRFNINLFNTGGRVNKNTGGMMSVLPKGREMDYRGGGVIPMGSKERADDVPARLSKNEFVMTADAVKAAGGGNVNKGAKRMYNLMHKLEARV